MKEKKSVKDVKIGDVFHYWVVIDYVGNDNSYRNKLVKCKCKCGTIRNVKVRHLLEGKSKSCGCLHKEIVSANSFVDITGRQFGRLTALEYVGIDKFQCRLWRCVCSCGNETLVTYSSLITGHTTSCGCYGKEARLLANTKHGLHKHRIYRILKNMKSRCYNPNEPGYNNYGGRGITICDEWLDPENGFMNFYNWSMSHGYRNDLFIERIDVNGPYAPWNCKWITNQEQQWNKQDTIKTIDGYPIAQFSYNYGIPWRHIRDHNPDVEYITVEELYERYFWPNGEPIIW